MKAIFEPEGRRRLSSFASRRTTLLAFDFDGTLAPINPNPSEARLAPRTEELLVRLSKNFGVAIISGRGLADLRKRLPADLRAALVGNHGLEDARPDSVRAQRAAAAWRRRFRSWRRPEPGIEIEDKGLTFSIHYRHCRRKGAARRAIASFCAELRPRPYLMEGKLVWNVIPEGSPTKGQALQRLMRKMGFNQALYVGDDVTDEDVFALEDPHILSIRIGRKKTSAAPYFLRRQPEIDRLLTALIAAENLSF